MKKFTIKIFTGFRCLFRSAYFLFALLVILCLSYLLGYGYLQGLFGGDALYHLSQIHWFDKFFPNVPYWYPLQNGGIVTMWGYPLISYFLVILLHRFSELSLAGAFQVLGFLSLPLTALGLYLFVWLRLKNQTMAIIGAVFYILAPISWVWLFDWGFYGESISYIFVFPALIFWDYFLSHYLVEKDGFLMRTCFFFTVIFLALLFLTHPTTFFITLAIIFMLTAIQALEKYKKDLLKVFKKSFLPFLFLMILTLSFMSFIFLDFYSYSKNSVGTVANLPQKTEFIGDYPTPLGSLLGLSKIPPTEFKFVHRNIVVPPAIWIAAIAGFVTSIFFSRKVFALALLGGLPIVLFEWPVIAFYIAKYIPFSYQFIHHRAVLLFLRLLIPIVGAFGVCALFQAFFYPLNLWFKKGRPLFIKNVFVIFTTSLLSLILASYLIVYFANKPQSLWRKTDIRYGPSSFDLQDIFPKKITTDLCLALQPSDPGRPKACDLSFVSQNLDISNFVSECNIPEKEKSSLCGGLIKGDISEKEFNNFVNSCSNGGGNEYCKYLKKIDPEQIANYLLKKDNWPQPKLTYDLEKPFSRFSNFINAHKNEKMLRIDVSPKLGGVVQTLNLESEISQINLYAAALSLLNPYWGHEQQVFFSKSTGDTVNVNNLAKWFGTKYLFMEDQLDSVEKYKIDSKNWKKVDEAGIWEFAQATKMYSWTKEKPAVLVIGSQKNRAYEPLYRVSVNGGFSYDDGWLVQGKENVDDYSLSELKKFDTLILFGYSYKNQKKAYKILDQYVKEGGNLFISTGWQYIDKDWESKKAPDFFPIEDLVWSAEYGKNSRYHLEDKEIGGEIDVSKFSPLVWSDQEWGVSIPLTGKRDWARTVLNIDGKPLMVAGQYGKGKVVWFGVNLVAHISTYDYNKEEMNFLSNVFNWLNGKPKEDESIQSQKIEATRNNPDRVEFEFKDKTDGLSTLYWRESQFPNWKASLIDNKGRKQTIKIYKAGPGFMLMRLPNIEKSDRLILEFDTGFRTLFGKLISIITLIGLLLYVFLGEKITRLLHIPLLFSKLKISKLISIFFSSFWDKE